MPSKLKDKVATSTLVPGSGTSDAVLNCVTTPIVSTTEAVVAVASPNVAILETESVLS